MRNPKNINFVASRLSINLKPRRIKQLRLSKITDTEADIYLISPYCLVAHCKHVLSPSTAHLSQTSRLQLIHPKSPNELQSMSIAFSLTSAEDVRCASQSWQHCERS